MPRYQVEWVRTSVSTHVTEVNAENEEQAHQRVLARAEASPQSKADIKYRVTETKDIGQVTSVPDQSEKAKPAKKKAAAKAKAGTKQPVGGTKLDSKQKDALDQALAELI